MSTAVVIHYIDAAGKCQTHRETNDAACTCDAICRAIDHMEQQGIDVDAIRSLTLVAKPMPEGAYLFASPEAALACAA